MKKILIVCELNFARSSTTEFIINRYSKKHSLEIEVESAGLFTKKLKRNPIESICYFLKKYIPFIPMKKVTKENVHRADKIIVMKEYMTTILKKQYDADPAKIINLNISEKYWFPYTPNLIKIIERKIDSTF
jgi:protein-tyrosine-phosphatase